MKVKIFNKKLRDSFFLKISLFSAFATLLLAFVPIPSKIQGLLGGVFLVFLVIIYIYDWRKANKLNSVEIDIEGTTVCIKEGDIFEEDGLKVIDFNEYFDTLVDNKIINEVSLNGIFLQKKLQHIKQNTNQNKANKQQNHKIKTAASRTSAAV